MRKFTGTTVYTINAFFRDIESNLALLPPLNELQKIIFIRNLLTGPAKMFMQTQPNLMTYDAFKSSLLDEFGTKISSADLHRQLKNRKLKQSESLLEYFISLREIASQGTPNMIDDSSIMEYCINNLPDSQSNKIMLYGCNSISEFKQKLAVYEKLFNERKRGQNSPGYYRSNNLSGRRDADGGRIATHRRDTQGAAVSNRFFAPQREFKADNSRSIDRHKPLICFNCNGINHLSKNCPDKDRGPRCIFCSNFGHISKFCPQKSPAPTNEVVNNVREVTPLASMTKQIQIFDVSLHSLVDTGSQVTLLTHDTWIRLGSPPLNTSTRVLTGFGLSKINVIGSFQAHIAVDGQNFPVHIRVVPNHSMNFDVILGCDVITQAKLTITPDGLFFSNPHEQSSDTSFDPLIFTITDTTCDFDVGPCVSKAERDDVRCLLEAYTPLKTKSTDIELHIQTTDDTPIYQSPRRLPFAERDIVDKQITEWLRDDVIEPCSSQYASPVLVVRKKDGSPRICIDYRRLNRVIVKDRYPLPVIDDLLDKLQNAQIFSTLDLKNGFFHVHVNKDSRHYTSFVTHTAQYQFKRVPFGLCSSPSVFQRFINTVFKDLIIAGTVLLYMDDLIIPAKDATEGIQRLKTVLSVASEYGLSINFKKSKFLHRRIEFLGHVIENGQLSPSPLKTKAVLNYPEPQSSKDVQRFIGLASYFRKYIQNFSTLAQPLLHMLKKNHVFHFGVNEKNSFNILKQSLANKPVLQIYNRNSETELHTDASVNGFGCILLQKSSFDGSFHPVYFMSRTTSDAEKKLSSYELEVLAVIYALQKFRVYLLGKPFKLVTDCVAFKLTMSKKDISAKIARWALLLQDFDYTIEHRSGSKMRHVDALSRSPVMLVTDDSVTLKIKEAQENDSEIAAIKQILKTQPYNDFFLKSDILYKFMKGYEVLVVPTSMHDTIIRDAHQIGHFAAKKVEESLKHDFFIPNLRDKIASCISNCVPCILNNRKRGKKEGMLHPLPKEDTPLHTYHIDHLGPLESTNKNYKFIFAVIDGFTKFAWLYPTKSTDAAEVLSKLQLQQQTFGNPSRIISDRGSAFLSKSFQDYCANENIDHLTVTTGLPRANGQIERLNSVIISVLSKLSTDDPTKWYMHVPRVQQVLNSTFQRSINTTPFELMFGTPMKTKHNLHITDLLNEELQSSFSTSRDELRQEAKQQILKVQAENCRTYNLRRKQSRKFNVNDLVAIKRTQYGPGLKLKSNFLGPYKITKVKSNDTYDVEKCSSTDGPIKTSTCIEFMKPWTKDLT